MSKFEIQKVLFWLSRNLKINVQRARGMPRFEPEHIDPKCSKPFNAVFKVPSFEQRFDA